MTELNDALTQITGQLNETFKAYKLQAVYPEGEKKTGLPVENLENGRSILTYEAPAGAVRFEYFGDRLTIKFAEPAEEGGYSAFTDSSASLLDLEHFNQKDVKYISGEIRESLEARFGNPSAGTAVIKAPKTVSKAAAKSGAVYYDANTLASRLISGLFPELRADYNDNIQTYGEFLQDDFFDRFGTPAVLEVIRQNDPVRMKKMFNIFNDIYPDATNETQDLIAVTVLGAMDNDQDLLARCVDYMSPELTQPVIKVNRFFATRAGKKAKEKLKNPPLYKPKKDKKKGGLLSMLGM